jgi:hypothetical protein
MQIGYLAMQETNLMHIEPRTMRKIRRMMRKEKGRTKISKKAIKNNFSIEFIYDSKSSKSMYSK